MGIWRVMAWTRSKNESSGFPLGLTMGIFLLGVRAFVMVMSVCKELRAARFGNAIVLIRAMPAAAAAAIAAVKMIFFGQDNQTVVVIVEVDPFDQIFHEVGVVFPFIRGGRRGLAGGMGSSFFILSINRWSRSGSGFSVNVKQM